MTRDVDVDSPVFITWEIEKGPRYELRGCIGTFEEKFLYNCLPEYALERYQHGMHASHHHTPNIP